jgi:hypothetical protein
MGNYPSLNLSNIVGNYIILWVELFYALVYIYRSIYILGGVKQHGKKRLL